MKLSLQEAQDLVGDPSVLHSTAVFCWQVSRAKADQDGFYHTDDFIKILTR